jgi:hypothetical protein
MTAEEHKVLVRRLVEEAVNAGNLDVLDEVAQGEFAVAIPFPTSGWGSPNWSPTARKWLRIPVLRDPPGGNGWVTRRPAALSRCR